MRLRRIAFAIVVVTVIVGTQGLRIIRGDDALLDLVSAQ